LKKLRVHQRNQFFVVITVFVLQFSLLTPHGIVYAQNEEYSHILTLESPNPENHAWFGYEVEIHGDIIVINEPYADVDDILDAGKIYVYDTDGNLISTIQSPTPGNNDNFGERFDQYGDTLIMKELSDIDDLLFAGKAHVFTTDGTHLLTLQSPDPIRGGYFGTAGIYEDLLVIYENKDEGVVHMFNAEGDYLNTLYSPIPIATGKFGRSIEVGETLILIGETGTGDVPRGPGSVHVFNHSGDHLMTLQAPEPEDRARFGTSISVSGDLIVIGENYATVDGVWRAGRAYIFNTDGELLQTLQSPNPKTNGEFGDSVAIDGDRLVVGEFDADVNPYQYEGRAYVYDIDGNLLQNLTAPDPCPRAAFGLDVDIDGDTIVVGECWAAIEDFGQAGRVQVYRLGAPVETQKTVEETAPVVEEEPEAETAGGIPGYPIETIVIGVTTVILYAYTCHKKTVITRQNNENQLRDVLRRHDQTHGTKEAET